MPALLPGPGTMSPLGRGHHTDDGIGQGGIPDNARRQGQATHTEESDAQVVHVGIVLAPFLGCLPLTPVVGFFSSVAMECVHEAVPCLV